MAENGRKYLKFVWKVENFSYIWNETDNFLKSPNFYLEVFEGSAWCLKLYPRGRPSYENYVGIYLERLSSSKGPLGITIDYEIALARANGETEYIREMKDRCFRNGYSYGFDNLVARERLVGERKPVLLPEDVLTLQCCIFPKNTELASCTEVSAKTHTQIERFQWQWKDIDCTENQFITLNSEGDGRNIWFSMNCDTPSGIDQYALCCKFHCEEEFKAFHCKVGVLDSRNSISTFLVNKFFDINSESSGLKYYLYFTLITGPELLKNKYLYLPNGKLSLDCEITLCFGLQHSQIEKIARGTTFTSVPAVHENASASEIDLPRKKFLYCVDNISSSLNDDFQNLYQEGTLCDFTIKVGDKNLKVHKAVLCARSLVFKAMLTSNMKEKEKNMVDISDLEEDTVDRMLTFIYTDKAGYLDRDAARKLYFAADKYGLMTLKRICSEVLKQSLSVTNVREILELANMHADEYLKGMTLEFIYGHELEIMCSTEWKSFMIEDLNLAAETMHQIFLKKAENRH